MVTICTQLPGVFATWRLIGRILRAGR